MKLEVIFLFFVISVLSSIVCKNSATGLIKEGKTNPSHYPKCFLTTPKWIRKYFGITQTVIPKYLYFELLLSILYVVLGPINFLIYGITGWKSMTAGILVLLHIGLIIVNTIFLGVMSVYMKK